MIIKERARAFEILMSGLFVRRVVFTLNLPFLLSSTLLYIFPGRITFRTIYTKMATSQPESNCFPLPLMTAGIEEVTKIYIPDEYDYTKGTRSRDAIPYEREILVGINHHHRLISIKITKTIQLKFLWVKYFKMEIPSRFGLKRKKRKDLFYNVHYDS